MLDARNVYRKVTRKIYDFSPEQQQNLLAIVWLYRGEAHRYIDLVAQYCTRTLHEGAGCFGTTNENGATIEPLPYFLKSIIDLQDRLMPFLNTLDEEGTHAESHKELIDALSAFESDMGIFKRTVDTQQAAWGKQDLTGKILKTAVESIAPLAETSRDLLKTDQCALQNRHSYDRDVREGLRYQDQ